MKFMPRDEAMKLSKERLKNSKPFDHNRDTSDMSPWERSCYEHQKKTHEWAERSKKLNDRMYKEEIDYDNVS